MVYMKQLGTREAGMSRGLLISLRFKDMEMKSFGQSDTAWIYWSAMMELKLINGC